MKVTRKRYVKFFHLKTLFFVPAHSVFVCAGVGGCVGECVCACVCMCVLYSAQKN